MAGVYDQVGAIEFFIGLDMAGIPKIQTQAQTGQVTQRKQLLLKMAAKLMVVALLWIPLWISLTAPALAQGSEVADVTADIATDIAGEVRERAVFAGGCFWCMEPPFDKLEGVISTTSGYIGGTVPNPSYAQVSSGRTGHTEAVEVVYDPDQVSYDQLLDIFWRNIDPLDPGGQFCDRGSQYRSGIFVQTESEQQAALASRARIKARFDQPIATDIVDDSPFYPAEDYHQDYYLKNPIRYQLYRLGCGRDGRLNALWGSEAGGH